MEACGHDLRPYEQTHTSWGSVDNQIFDLDGVHIIPSDSAQLVFVIKYDENGKVALDRGKSAEHRSRACVRCELRCHGKMSYVSGFFKRQIRFGSIEPLERKSVRDFRGEIRSRWECRSWREARAAAGINAGARDRRDARRRFLITGVVDGMARFGSRVLSRGAGLRREIRPRRFCISVANATPAERLSHPAASAHGLRRSHRTEPSFLEAGSRKAGSSIRIHSTEGEESSLIPRQTREDTIVIRSEIFDHRSRAPDHRGMARRYRARSIRLSYSYNFPTRRHWRLPRSWKSTGGAPAPRWASVSCSAEARIVSLGERDAAQGDSVYIVHGVVISARWTAAYPALHVRVDDSSVIAHPLRDSSVSMSARKAKRSSTQPQIVADELPESV